MFKSDSIVNISAALSKAQKNIGAASKEAKNPFFKSKYADLGSVMEACKDALNAQGITVLQPVSFTSDGRHAVETILLHESGEWLGSTMILELGRTDMQQLGSAISYGRRYGLQSFVFIPAQDDDFEGGMNRNEPKPVQVAAPKAKVEVAPVTKEETPVVTKAKKDKPTFKQTPAPQAEAGWDD